MEDLSRLSQISDERAFGRVLLRGEYVRQHESDIRKRIANVAERARFTQPERRLVSIEAGREASEVLTTSRSSRTASCTT